MNNKAAFSIFTAMKILIIGSGGREHAFAWKMALRRGGLYGVKKAIESENIGTCVYNSGLQVTGVFTDVIEDDGHPIYIKTTGPTSLNYKNRQVEGHGKK